MVHQAHTNLYKLKLEYAYFIVCPMTESHSERS